MARSIYSRRRNHQPLRRQDVTRSREYLDGLTGAPMAVQRPFSAVA